MSEQRLIDIAPILSKLDKEKQEHEKRLTRYKQLKVEEPDNNYNDWEKKIAYEQDWISEINHSVAMLENAPTIEPPVVQWVSVKDRLPEDFVKVLTTDHLGHMHISFHHYKYKFPFNISPDDYSLYQPTHWMPLPEPPKGDEP